MTGPAILKQKGGAVIRLYGYGPTRSIRPKWMLQELGVDYEFVEGRSLIGTDEYRKVHPQAKLPALEHNGKVLFESVAITNYLADMYPEAGLIAKSGTFERALHDQWSCFALAELEAWVWSSARHTFILPEEKRVPAIIAANSEEFRKSAKVVDDALAGKDYIVADRFSAADINLAYSLNWGRNYGLTQGLENVNRYVLALHQRPASTLPEQSEFLAARLRK